MSGTTPNRSVAPPAAMQRPVFTSSKISSTPSRLRQLAHRLEIPGLGEDDAEVHHRGLHDHAGGRAPFLDERLDPPLHRARVVERNRDRSARPTAFGIPAPYGIEA